MASPASTPAFTIQPTSITQPPGKPRSLLGEAFSKAKVLSQMFNKAVEELSSVPVSEKRFKVVELLASLDQFQAITVQDQLQTMTVNTNDLIRYCKDLGYLIERETQVAVTIDAARLYIIEALDGIAKGAGSEFVASMPIESFQKKAASSLKMASERGFKVVVDAILKRAAQEQITLNLEEPFKEACIKGHLNIAEALVVFNKDLLAQVTRGQESKMTPLLSGVLAHCLDDKRAEEFACQLIPKITFETEITYFETLMSLIKRQFLEAIKCLLERDAEVKFDYKSFSPLHAACALPSTDKTEQIVRLFASKDNMDLKFGPDEETPLYIACRNLNVKAVQVLCELHANPNITARSGKAPVHIIAGIDRPIQPPESCSASPASSVKSTSSSSTHKSSPTPFRSPISPPKSSSLPSSPLDNRVEMPLQSLLPRVGPVHSSLPLEIQMNPQEKRSTPLESFNPAPILEIIPLLKTARADFNLAQDRIPSPIHCACVEGVLAIVTALYEAGAKANTQDLGGNYPIDLAKKHGHSSVAKYLKDKTPVREE